MEIVFGIIAFILFAMPGIIWLYKIPGGSARYEWMFTLAVGILAPMFVGAGINKLIGWYDFWGFLIAWLLACTLAWWVPTYERNRRGRLASATRLAEPEAVENPAATDAVPDAAPAAEAAPQPVRSKLRNKRKK